MLFGNKAEDIESLRNEVSLSSDKFNALQAFTKTLYSTKGRVSDEDLDAFFAAGYTKPQALDVITNISAKVISNFANQLAINI
ncbi:MAG: carboxymuconolactone decarboxylase family protein, partial [Flavobacteriaceae bacterium]|nr:carboxymuconolactone decarboxylase family protein [Flavobacteriaceae bacterium]